MESPTEPVGSRFLTPGTRQTFGGQPGEQLAGGDVDGCDPASPLG
jgi:hypothetical protein